MQKITEAYLQSDSWYEIKRAVDNGQEHIYMSGATMVGKALLLALVQKQWNWPMLVVASSTAHAGQWMVQLQSMFGEEEVAYFPPEEVLLYGVLAQGPELSGQRLALMASLVAGKVPKAIVTTWDALLIRMVPPVVFKEHTLRLAEGQALKLADFVLMLHTAGYERVELVESMGQFAVRGGLVDVFPLVAEEPVRIEFFGDDIDSLRSYDLTTQRSISRQKSVLVPPAREAFWPEKAVGPGVERLTQILENIVRRLEPERGVMLRKNIGHDLERLKEGHLFPGRGKYLSFFIEHCATLLDYLPTETLAILDEPSRLLEKAEGCQKDLEEQYKALLIAGQLLPTQHRVFSSDTEVMARLEKFRTFMMATLPKRPARLRVDGQVTVLQKAIPNYFGQLSLLSKDVKRLAASGYRILAVAPTANRQAEIINALMAEDIAAQPWSIDAELPPPGTFSVVVGTLTEGVELPEIKLYLLAEDNLSGKSKLRKRRPVRAAGEGARLTSHRDLAVGDFVVHLHHGIGKYIGVRTMEIAGTQRDYIEIHYNAADKLYVPADQLHLVQKYVGGEGKEPKLHALGGTDWAKTRAKVRESVEKMAEELLALYAKRASLVGYAAGPDKPWQLEMEGNFAYVETADQLRSIEEVKKDMESPEVMERLLCGDVGYGKTEVAVRAAFKAVMEGKQVAVLVPTTILAQQHYHTFRERFAGFPIEVALLNRFRSAEDNRETAKRISAGIVDVAIGTHRLFNADVRFKDLGLLVIDEEQRFGVQHKEKIKMVRHNVDVLSLSATPIPRTLHMAMVGLRDVSVIETPPEDRYPVQTYVIEHDSYAIKHAILREIERGGQVYYVHNRVRTIKSVASYLQVLLPEARIAVGHGQMAEETLERIFLDFLEGEYDILLSTTIVESGLDIANVNTIVVEDADKLGLAQLYQLRGRVGRSNRVGYAYFTYRPDKTLTEVAEKRLSALREFTQLGAGFKIALRDLEIRGAGNILGPEQHGFVASVGFDLYCQLLEEAVRTLKGEKVAKPIECEIKLPVDAYFPSRYIRDSQQKVEMYKKAASARHEAEIIDILDELVDRYGDLPEPVENLLLIARLKILAGKLGCTLVTTTDKGMLLKLDAEAALDPAVFSAVHRQFHELGIQNHKGYALTFRSEGRSLMQSVTRLIEALRLLIVKEK
ncbi:MAG: Transcription-repair-coupling factor [Firmicutes bacterium]|nr:Transcription-repair-coupling factor [Bacillota bacterium]